MVADVFLVTIIVGAPGCGKTTLAPFIAVLMDLARARGFSAAETAQLIDEFIDLYKDVAPADSLALLVRVAAEHGLGMTLDGDPTRAVRSRVAETGDYNNYHDSQGRVRRALTAPANAFMLSRAVKGDASVLISGTGMAMHRFLPLFRKMPAVDFKVVIPICGYHGFFRNSYERATAVRSGLAGVTNGRSVDAAALQRIYAKQEACYAPGGLWDQIKGLRKGADLEKIIAAHRCGDSESEVQQIGVHLDLLCSAPARRNCGGAP